MKDWWNRLVAQYGLHEAEVHALAYYLHTLKPKEPDEICIAAARWILPHYKSAATDGSNHE